MTKLQLASIALGATLFMSACGIGRTDSAPPANVAPSTAASAKPAASAAAKPSAAASAPASTAASPSAAATTVPGSPSPSTSASPSASPSAAATAPPGTAGAACPKHNQTAWQNHDNTAYFNGPLNSLTETCGMTVQTWTYKNNVKDRIFIFWIPAHMVARITNFAGGTGVFYDPAWGPESDLIKQAKEVWKRDNVVNTPTYIARFPIEGIPQDVLASLEVPDKDGKSTKLPLPPVVTPVTSQAELDNFKFPALPGGATSVAPEYVKQTSSPLLAGPPGTNQCQGATAKGPALMELPTNPPTLRKLDEGKTFANTNPTGCWPFASQKALEDTKDKHLDQFGARFPGVKIQTPGF